MSQSHNLVARPSNELPTDVWGRLLGLVALILFFVGMNAGAANPPREIEPNNTTSTATAIAINDGETRGQLSSIADIDYYVFNSTGGVVSFTISPENNSYDGTSLSASIIAQDGTVITSKDINSDSPPTSLGASTSFGPYYLMFQKNQYSVMTKDYVINSAYAPALLRENEPNNNMASATLLVGGSEVRGQLSSVTDIDYYVFSSTGGVASFAISPETSSYNGTSLSASILAQDGTVISARDINSDSPTVTLAGSTNNGIRYYLMFKKNQYIVMRKDYVINVSGAVSTTGGAPARFIAVAPCRLVDTRAPGSYPISGGRLAAGETRSFALPSSSCGIPANALAYSVNATVVPTGSLGWLTLWPTGSSQPGVSTLNAPDGRVKANAAIVPAGTGGAVSAYVSNSTDLILDINGYFVAAGSGGDLAFYPMAPCRLSDTRFAPGLNGGPTMGSGETRSIATWSLCGIPAGAAALALNYTVIPQGPLGWLTTWPTGQAQPSVSTLNAPTGTVVANAAIVPTGSSGQLNIYVTNLTDVIVDVNGYFAPVGTPGALSFYAATPCRVADTRLPAGPFGGPQMSAGSTRSFALPASPCAIPAAAQAYSLNATVVPSGGLSWLTLWPTGGSQPGVSTLNAFDGALTSNAALVPAGTSGGINTFVTDPTHLILDINGYFAP